ncbi:hypothetical protein MH117_06350 [Paenibacillus sp. ACRRX]|uniref:peroxiredoxin family protein n=1 Tax=Paenibacillus sp. ACRRX TaxID=2918206 RepID=UPI001EF60F03|nr:hypothetical protein [Paenibacillus sp. ACRRX]MCG7407034.1 hypothetical protein [Paenibacillus sp. ACRRX]
MTKVKFEDLFAPGAGERLNNFIPARLQAQTPTPTVIEGMRFQSDGVYDHFESHPSAIVVIVSLTCLGCIDMLPDLNTFASSYEGKFIMICSGADEEIQELVQHFQYPFPVVAMSDTEYTARYGVDATPYVFHLAGGMITHSYSINGIRDLQSLASIVKGAKL